VKDVIREFNEKRSERFGENFKQLNEAIGQVLVWQETTPTANGRMIDQQQITSQNMATATERYQSGFRHGAREIGNLG
jgi:hypothetical protein